MRNKILLIAVLLLSACSKSSSSNQLGSNMGMPGKSITTISPSLYRTANNSLKQYVQKELSCSEYEIVDTLPIATIGDLVMNNEGQLTSGGVQEEWKIVYCGYGADLGIELAADGSGGTYVSIERLDADGGPTAGIGNTGADIGGGPRYLGRR